MTITETLDAYAERVGLLLRNPEEDGPKIRSSTSNEIIHFAIAACGHDYGHGTAIKNLKPHPPPFVCKKCVRVVKLEAEKGITVDYHKKEIRCLAEDCGRVYRRDNLVKNIAQFTCYCKTKRRVEGFFYDAVVARFGLDMVRRSFDGWGTGLNHSSDMTIRSGEGLWIVELDDVSHSCQKNRDSDIWKAELALERGLKIVHIDQETFLVDPQGTLDALEGTLAAQEGLPLSTISHRESFYKYLEDVFEETLQVILLE